MSELHIVFEKFIHCS